MITMIYASTNDGVIGNGLEIPWHIPADFKHFKKYTTGKTVVMGRKTAESIGKPLPNRTNLVMSANKTENSPDGIFKEDGWIYIDHTDLIYEFADEQSDFIVMGGSFIYKLFEPYADRVLWTEVKGSFEGDIHFKLKDNWPNRVKLNEDDDCIYWELTR